jgi:hypothetical protein
MRRIFLAIALAIGLALASGCSTEPIYSKDGASNSDRMKGMSEARAEADALLS